MSTNMWVAITEIVVGVIMIVGLALWLSKKAKISPKNSSKDNLADLLEASKNVSPTSSRKNSKVGN